MRIVSRNYPNFEASKEEFKAEPNYFLGHLANIELDHNNQITMGGIN